jgi:hypothetical protein
MSAAAGLFIMIGLFVLGSDIKKACKHIADAMARSKKERP